jgi:hypothetical protein
LPGKFGALAPGVKRLIQLWWRLEPRAESLA